MVILYAKKKGERNKLDFIGSSTPLALFFTEQLGVFTETARNQRFLFQHQDKWMKQLEISGSINGGCKKAQKVHSVRLVFVLMSSE